MLTVPFFEILLLAGGFCDDISNRRSVYHSLKLVYYFRPCNSVHPRVTLFVRATAYASDYFIFIVLAIAEAREDIVCVCVCGQGMLAYSAMHCMCPSCDANIVPNKQSRNVRQSYRK